MCSAGWGAPLHMCRHACLPTTQEPAPGGVAAMEEDTHEVVHDMYDNSTQTTMWQMDKQRTRRTFGKRRASSRGDGEVCAGVTLCWQLPSVILS